jgi:hypothetical protein
MANFFSTQNLRTSLNFGLKLFLFLLPWQTVWIYREIFLKGAKWQYGTLTFYATEVLLWLVVLLFFGWYLKKSNIFHSEVGFSWSKDRLFLFSCLLFVLYSFGSVFWAIDPNLALQSSLWILEALLLFLIISIGPVDTKQIALWFVAGGVVQSILAIIQFFAQSTFNLTWLGLAAHPVAKSGVSVVASESIGRWLRAYGSFSHPNVLGGYLSLCLIILLAVFSNRIFKQYHKRILFISASVLLTMGIILSFSRAAWLISISALLFLPLHARIERRLNTKQILHSIIPALAAVFVLIIALFPLVQTRVAGSSQLEEKSVSHRLTGLQLSTKVVENNILFGVGSGNYTTELIKMIPDKPGWFYQPVHNIFVLLLAELGVAGILLLFGVVVSWVYFIFYNHDVPPKVIYFVTMLFFTVLVAGSVDHYLASSYVGWMLLAVGLGLISKMELSRVDKN